MRFTLARDPLSHTLRYLSLMDLLNCIKVNFLFLSATAQVLEPSHSPIIERDTSGEWNCVSAICFSDISDRVDFYKAVQTLLHLLRSLENHNIYTVNIIENKVLTDYFNAMMNTQLLNLSFNTAIQKISTSRDIKSAVNVLAFHKKTIASVSAHLSLIRTRSNLLNFTIKELTKFVFAPPLTSTSSYFYLLACIIWLVFPQGRSTTSRALIAATSFISLGISILSYRSKDASNKENNNTLFGSLSSFKKYLQDFPINQKINPINQKIKMANNMSIYFKFEDYSTPQKHTPCMVPAAK